MNGSLMENGLLPRRLRPFFYIVLGLSLLACAGEEQAPAQHWEGIEVSIETRPNPPRIGINEVVISTTRPHRQAEYNLLVSIRVNENEKWVQTIQDGHTGIFRRGLPMNDAGAQTLWVKLEGRETLVGKQTVLHFPITVAP